jgi:hypothetical protein
LVVFLALIVMIMSVKIRYRENGLVIIEAAMIFFIVLAVIIFIIDIARVLYALFSVQHALYLGINTASNADSFYIDVHKLDSSPISEDTYNKFVSKRQSIADSIKLSPFLSMLAKIDLQNVTHYDKLQTGVRSVQLPFAILPPGATSHVASWGNEVLTNSHICIETTPASCGTVPVLNETNSDNDSIILSQIYPTEISAYYEISTLTFGRIKQRVTVAGYPTALLSNVFVPPTPQPTAQGFATNTPVATIATTNSTPTPLPTVQPTLPPLPNDPIPCDRTPSQMGSTLGSRMCPPGYNLHDTDDCVWLAVPNPPASHPSGLMQCCLGAPGYICVSLSETFIATRNSLGCFLPTAKVKVSDKDEKRISELKIGDLVYNPSLDTYVAVKNIVAGKEFDPMIEIVSTRAKITVTSGHPIYTVSGFVRAKDLREGDIIYNDSFKLDSVLSVKSTSEYLGGVVMNIELDIPEGILNNLSQEPEYFSLATDGFTTGSLELQRFLEEKLK